MNSDNTIRLKYLSAAWKARKAPGVGLRLTSLFRRALPCSGGRPCTFRALGLIWRCLLGGLRAFTSPFVPDQSDSLSSSSPSRSSSLSASSSARNRVLFSDLFSSLRGALLIYSNQSSCCKEAHHLTPNNQTALQHTRCQRHVVCNRELEVPCTRYCVSL